MIDLHCHILPGIDDGAQTLEDAVEMAKAAVNDGISHILCTPHHNNGMYINPKSEVIKHVLTLQDVLDKQGIPLTLFEGQEVRISGELLSDIKENKILFADMQDQFLLIEFPSNDVPAFTEHIFFELLSKEITPIIVHPERNHFFIDDPNRMIPYLEMGVLSQLTSPSYLGLFGKKIQKTAKAMVKHNLVQMVATDAHNVKKRNFNLTDFYSSLQNDFGEKKVEAYKNMSKAIVNGDPVEPVKFTPIQKTIWGLK